MAERTRIRRIRRIGPIYGATCHRGGFRRCEILPAMILCETRRIRDTRLYIRREILEKRKHTKIDVGIKNTRKLLETY